MKRISIPMQTLHENLPETKAVSSGGETTYVSDRLIFEADGVYYIGRFNYSKSFQRQWLVLDGTAADMSDAGSGESMSSIGRLMGHDGYMPLTEGLKKKISWGIADAPEETKG
jgi:hypothetical protein